MDKLFLHIGVYALLTAAVAFACFRLVRFDERRKPPR